MARSVRPLLDRVDAALAEAQRRVPPDPLAGLSPVWRRYVENWQNERTPDEIFEAIRNGTHPLSTVDIYPHDKIAASATSQELAELWEKVRES